MITVLVVRVPFHGTFRKSYDYAMPAAKTLRLVEMSMGLVDSIMSPGNATLTYALNSWYADDTMREMLIRFFRKDGWKKGK